MAYYLLARKKSSVSLNQENSDISGGISGDRKSRESKSAPYRHAGYPTLLATQGSYMKESKLGITVENKNTYQKYLSEKQELPENSLFRDDLFKALCEKVHTRNEAIIVQDITRLIVPSAENLAIYGATKLGCLVESVNEAWTNCIPVTKPRPQPDYSVGFARGAFTDDQLKKIKPFVGNLLDTSFFMATWYMYFPFLTCEVKCGAAAFEIADRQNAHSMTVAVRAVVELHRHVKQEKKLHREILAFSVSHDHQSVRLYGHYPLIDGNKTTFYRHLIHKFDFTFLDGKEKWTAYTFIMNIYNTWMPVHLERICSAIDSIPSDKKVESSQSASFTERSDILSSGEEAENLANASEISGSQNSCFKKPRLTPTILLKEQVDDLKRQMEQKTQESHDLKEQVKQLLSMLNRNVT